MSEDGYAWIVKCEFSNFTCPNVFVNISARFSSVSFRATILFVSKYFHIVSRFSFLFLTMILRYF